MSAVDGEALEIAKRKILKELLKDEKIKECCSKPPSRELVEVTSTEEFHEKIKSCRLAIAFFYTPTCPYCKMMEPLVEAAAELLGDRVVFVKVNAAYLYEVAGMYYIMGTPTTIAFRNGEEVDRIVGLVPVEVFEEFLTRLLEEGNCPLPEDAGEA
ncbi:MAG: thioredoxin family protein [Desulfurococcales archaeon]|nr:thioredoxin family protein [Desulfurococcales archaeon]